MSDHKKYLVMVYFNHEGWCIVGEADTSEEILEVYKEQRKSGGDILVVKNIPVVLRIESEDE